MKWGKLVAFFVIIALIISAAAFLANPIQKNINLGLDLQGGIQVRLQAKGEVREREIQQVMAIMSARVDKLGVVEPNIQQEGNNRVLIELPGIEDPDTAIELIGKTAFLEFITHDGKTILTGKDLAEAQEALDPTNQEPIVLLKFNAEGTRVFAEVTQQLVDEFAENDERRIIGIYLDGEPIQMPYVQTAIPSGEARITGYKSLEDAHNIALLLQSGALPVPVEIIETRTVGPTLGSDSLVKSKDAAIWGIGAIMLFMLILYRLPGIIANVSLVLYALIVLGALIWMGATLTLPGIAGFLLSVGMCVDANILIYERMKDELRNGKTLRAAIDAGFSRAFWAIFDSNVTTLLAAGVLFYLGTGTIKGFAVTLSIGIISSMFTAITFSRYMLKLLAESRTFKNLKLFGL